MQGIIVRACRSRSRQSCAATTLPRAQEHQLRTQTTDARKRDVGSALAALKAGNERFLFWLCCKLALAHFAAIVLPRKLGPAATKALRRLDVLPLLHRLPVLPVDRLLNPCCESGA